MAITGLGAAERGGESRGSVRVCLDTPLSLSLENVLSAIAQPPESIMAH